MPQKEYSVLTPRRLTGGADRRINVKCWNSIPLRDTIRVLRYSIKLRGGDEIFHVKRRTADKENFYLHDQNVLHVGLLRPLVDSLIDSQENLGLMWE